jgi:hypothetical protein
LAEFGRLADFSICLKGVVYVAYSITRPLPKMAKTPSPSPSPGKLLEAKLLLARAESKAKARGKSKKVGTTKPAKSASKASAAR